MSPARSRKPIIIEPSLSKARSLMIGIGRAHGVK